MHEYFEESQVESRSRHNIYLAKVTRVEPSLDACFVEFGGVRHGFLPMSEVVANPWCAFPADKKNPRIEEVVKAKQALVVQVDKDPVSTKGARLTTDLSLAGRYLVLTPHSDRRGVSRKIDDPELRQQYRDIADKLSAPKGMGFILRTAVSGQTRRDLERDMNFLVRLWGDIEQRARGLSQPELIYSEGDIIQRVLRDYFSNDIDQVWIDRQEGVEQAAEFFKVFLPRQRSKVQLYSGKVPIFAHFGVETQIEDIFRRRVEMPSGGSLVIEPTEALVSIDVNSGKTKGFGNQEEMAYETNLEAAQEVARQLRLRNLGGIVVIDFIDMTDNGHISGVERRLKEALKEDKARYQMGKISSFGLCTLTRQRLEMALGHIGFRQCPMCRGDGMIRSPESVAPRLLRKIQTRVADGSVEKALVKLHPKLAHHMQNKLRKEILALEHEFCVSIEIEGTHELQLSDDQMDFTPKPPERMNDRCYEKPEKSPDRPGERSDEKAGERNQDRPNARVADKSRESNRARRGGRGTRGGDRHRDRPSVQGTRGDETKSDKVDQGKERVGDSVSDPGRETTPTPDSVEQGGEVSANRVSPGSERNRVRAREPDNWVAGTSRAKIGQGSDSQRDEPDEPGNWVAGTIRDPLGEGSDSQRDEPDEPGNLTNENPQSSSGPSFGASPSHPGVVPGAPGEPRTDGRKKRRRRRRKKFNPNQLKAKVE